MDYLPPSFGRVDPDLKPTAQREISFGAEKKLMENLSLSVRLVNKHLIRTIEDVGALAIETDPETGETSVTEDFWIANPGYGVSLPISQGGKFIDDLYWPAPKAKREYLGLNLALEKRFSNNWQGGINYTLSRLTGNYSGLASSDEVYAPARPPGHERRAGITTTGSSCTTPGPAKARRPAPPGQDPLFQGLRVLCLPVRADRGRRRLRPERPALDDQALYEQPLDFSSTTAATWAACRSPSGLISILDYAVEARQ